ncbi:hypothetical protein BG842_03975 [Haladaptatus sp. W1]|nr:hypothetical protein BG842_03975 [Haladaptatus sp. W1]
MTTKGLMDAIMRMKALAGEMMRKMALLGEVPRQIAAHVRLAVGQKMGKIQHIPFRSASPL